LVKGKVVESLLINDERFNPKLMKNAKIEALKDEQQLEAEICQKNLHSPKKHCRKRRKGLAKL